MVEHAGEPTWEQFLQALTEYRDAEFTHRSAIDGERAYLALITELADVPIASRSKHAASIVLFLNRWRCHFARQESREAIAAWVLREAPNLEALASSSIVDANIEGEPEFDRIYDSLISLRRGDPRISTMGDACASKLLHQMIPELFVMWDLKIKVGHSSYGQFLVHMQRLALRLRDELAPAEARSDIEGYFQRELGYPVRKPLAKYIDEYNWWRAYPRPGAVPLM